MGKTAPTVDHFVRRAWAWSVFLLAGAIWIVTDRVDAVGLLIVSSYFAGRCDGQADG